MPWRRLAPLLVIALVVPWAGAPADDPAVPDDAALLDFFRQRTVHATPRDFARLTEQLSDDSFEVREQATEQLKMIGAPALSPLVPIADSSDAEVRRRVADIRQHIDTAVDGPLIRAAARRVAERKPADAAAVLLDYLPARADEATAEALRTAVSAVAFRDGRPEPAVLRALTDPLPVRRAAAGVALSRAGGKERLPLVRPLLQDRDPYVRLNVGLTMAALDDKDAIPALIGVLDAAPRSLLAPVEDLLYTLADDKAPAVAMGKDAADHRKFRESWAEWWKKDGAAVDLRRARQTPYLDHTVVLLLDKGQMIELDSDDKPVWELDDLGFPLDVQILSGGRVLVADHGGGRVVERHHDGTILWEKQANGPLVAQRLPNGNTFIATKWELLEVDRADNVVFEYQRPDGEEFMRAVKLPDGDIACVIGHVPRPRRFIRLDSAGHEKSRFTVNVHTSGGRIDVLPDGRVLIPVWSENCVVEYSPTGKPLRDFPIGQPIAAQRLPNGNTLMTSMSDLRAVEVDPAGKEVWQYSATTRVTRALRR